MKYSPRRRWQRRALGNRWNWSIAVALFHDVPHSNLWCSLFCWLLHCYGFVGVYPRLAYSLFYWFNRTRNTASNRSFERNSIRSHMSFHFIVVIADFISLILQNQISMIGRSNLIDIAGVMWITSHMRREWKNNIWRTNSDMWKFWGEKIQQKERERKSKRLSFILVSDFVNLYFI